MSNITPKPTKQTKDVKDTLAQQNQTKGKRSAIAIYSTIAVALGLTIGLYGVKTLSPELLPSQINQALPNLPILSQPNKTEDFPIVEGEEISANITKPSKNTVEPNSSTSIEEESQFQQIAGSISKVEMYRNNAFLTRAVRQMGEAIAADNERINTFTSALGAMRGAIRDLDKKTSSLQSMLTNLEQNGVQTSTTSTPDSISNNSLLLVQAITQLQMAYNTGNNSEMLHNVIAKLAERKSETLELATRLKNQGDIITKQQLINLLKTANSEFNKQQQELNSNTPSSTPLWQQLVNKVVKVETVNTAELSSKQQTWKKLKQDLKKAIFNNDLNKLEGLINSSDDINLAVLKTKAKVYIQQQQLLQKLQQNVWNSVIATE